MKHIHFYQIICSLLLLGVFFLLTAVNRERRLLQETTNELINAQMRIPREISVDEERFPRRLLSNEEPVIFVGGIPRSGTTLMRAMLDAHPDIRCGEETMIIPNIIEMRQSWRVGFFNKTDMQNTMDEALTSFLLEMIAKNGKMAKRLCNKDPFTASQVTYLRTILPNSRFILMIRDARAVVHSMIDREVPVGGFNRTDPEQMLRQWNKFFLQMYGQCSQTEGTCLKVFYERLVQKPETEMRRILDFLDIKWSNDVIRHHELIGSEVKLNPQEFSTSQVIEEVNKKALTSWFDCFSNETLEKLDKLAPMLKKMGYDTENSHPSYEDFAAEDFYEKRLFV